jgi:hypothetical protein
VKRVPSIVKILLATVLLIGGPQVYSLRAANIVSIIRPQPGELLYFGDTIEVAVSGLYIDLVPKIDVVVWAKNEQGVFPIMSYAGSHYFPLREASEATLDTPAKLIWIDKQFGQAHVLIKWNWLPVGFSDGSYDLKVEFFVRVNERIAVFWAETSWQSNKLVAKQWIDIDSPAPGVKFYRGDQIRVSGSVFNLRPPVNVSLEVSKTLQDWKTVNQTRLYEKTFELFWNTENEVFGEYWIRVRAEDGQVLLSEPRNVLLVSRPVPPKISIYGKRFVGVDLRFFIVEGEQHWASFEWDFGDGTTSVEASPTHRYLKAGKYVVKLTTYSEPGFKGDSQTIQEELSIEERVAIQRTVLGYPRLAPQAKYVLYNQTIGIRLEIKILYPIDAVTIRETAPIGYVVIPGTWEVKAGDMKVMALCTRVNERTIQWVFHAETGTSTTGLQLREDVTITVSYSVSLQSPPKEVIGKCVTISGTAQVSVEGMLQDLKVQGEDAFWVVDSLPVCVAIAFLKQTSQGEWELKPPDEGSVFLTEENLGYARHFLQTREVVPYTNQTLSIDMYLKLYTMFLYRIPVTQCEALSQR